MTHRPFKGIRAKKFQACLARNTLTTACYAEKSDPIASAESQYPFANLGYDANRLVSHDSTGLEEHPVLVGMNICSTDAYQFDFD